MAEDEVIGRVHAEIDDKSVRIISKLLEPSWFRFLSFALPIGAMGAFFYRERTLAGGLMAAAVAYLIIQLIRHLRTEYVANGWLSRVSAGSERYAITEQGFRVQQELVPWSSVTELVQIENPKAGFTLLALRAAGQWRVWPSHGFVEGTFASTRSLAVDKIGHEPRRIAL